MTPLNGIFDHESDDLGRPESADARETGELDPEMPLEVSPEAMPEDSLEDSPEGSVSVSIEPTLKASLKALLDLESDTLTAEPDATSLDPLQAVEDRSIDSGVSYSDQAQTAGAPGQPGPSQPGPGQFAFGPQGPKPSDPTDIHHSGGDHQTANTPSEQVDDMTETTTPPVEEWDALSDETMELDDRVSTLEPDHPVAKFVGQNCRVEDGEITGAKELYVGYLRWCDDTGTPPMLQRSFGMALTQMGFNRRRNWAWWGLCLSEGGPPNDEDNDQDA